MKEIVLLGGPNGAGKTTAARVLLPRFLHYTFLNADDIAREIASDNPESAALAAGRVLIERMREIVRIGNSFAWKQRVLESPTFRL